jgi:hypothetical protein
MVSAHSAIKNYPREEKTATNENVSFLPSSIRLIVAPLGFVVEGCRMGVCLGDPPGVVVDLSGFVVDLLGFGRTSA